MDPLTPAGTDPLTDLLNGVRGTGAVFNQTSVSGAWAVRFQDDSPLAMAVIISGEAWVTPHRGQPVRLGPGDVAVFSGGEPYVIASDPDTEPDILIRPGGHCTTTDGRQTITTRGVGSWGTTGPDSTVLLNGLYTTTSSKPHRLLTHLPPLAVLTAGQGHCPVSQEALEDAGRPQPGRQILLDRILDLMLITALRAWFTRPDAPIPAWYRAHSDPTTGHALQLLHNDLARPWTVQSLAAETGVSRAALAARFNALVGQPPMTYLREQRVTLAAELLREPGTTLHAVAGRVGFSTAFALSATFKKVRGISPSQHRADSTPAS